MGSAEGLQFSFALLVSDDRDQRKLIGDGHADHGDAGRGVAGGTEDAFVSTGLDLLNEGVRCDDVDHGAGIVFWVFVRRQDDAIQVMHMGVLGPGADHFVAIVEGAVHGHVAVLIGFVDSFACCDDGACAGYAVNVVQACYRAGREGAVDEGFVAGVDGGGDHFYEEVSGGGLFGLRGFGEVETFLGGDADGSMRKLYQQRKMY